MLELKLIVCPVDFSEFSARAYRHAQSLAEHYRAKLLALHVVELYRHLSLDFAPASLYDEACEALCENGRQHLHEFVENHTHKEIQPQMVVTRGMPADVILSVAQAHEANVIVMGTHGRRGFDRLMLGSVTDRVMRTAPCPVLVVGRSPHDSAATGDDQGPNHRLIRILFCADFSQDSEHALKYALSAREEYDAELTLLHVLEGPTAEMGTAALSAAAEKLGQLIPADGRKSPKFKTAVRVGKPYQQIIEFAQQTQTDLVGMGVRGRGALDVAVFGSTTYRVMQLGPCPVLVVHHRV
jgi:nucleotide-binding universal stress UspA family protein